jgi:hypothetical protein
VALVPYVPTNRPVNLNVTIDETLLARIDQAALAAGESRSMFLAKAAQQRLALRSGSEGMSSTPTPTAVGVQPPAPVAAEHDGTPDASNGQDAAGATITPVLAPVIEPLSVATEPTDTATSLATIREILEHLDQSGVKQARPAELRPARRA